MVEILTTPIIAEGIGILLTGTGICMGAIGIGLALYLWLLGMRKA